MTLPTATTQASSPVATGPAGDTGTSAEASKMLDTEMLQRMQKTHPTLLGRLITTYIGYAPKAVVQLQEALDTKSHAALKATAHSLKSSSANVGAAQLSGLCRDLEARLKATSDWDDATNPAAVAAIAAAYAATEVALMRLQSEIKPVPAKTASA